ncbi:phosphonate ABC transporter ATP-binding protein [Variovorax sp. RT4R15]|uniref:phosphonate ABC transporter ATP-binding protein n=1 Tax=Variovorax sp. RT4R15 TaxID=3443737 RepID=UPI003F4801C8
MTLSLQGVVLRYHANGFTAIADATLQVGQGERVAVIGPSGAGKTSLLRIAGTSVRASEGRVAVLGQQPWALPASALKALRARIGVVHQAPPIPPRLRVVTAVLAGKLGAWSALRAMKSLLVPADAAGAQAALARLGLGDRVWERCDRLSGGQLQRVGIARVLYQEPDLMLADEPVSALDPTLADATLRELVAQSEATGATLVASLHAVDLALKWFGRIVGMREGRIVFDMAAADVTPTMLQDLYAAEGGVVPVHGVDAIAGAGEGTADSRASALMCR